MRKARFFTALIIAFLSKFKVILILSVILGIALFFLSRVVVHYMNKTETEYVGQVGRFHIDELPVEVLSLIGEGLTKIDETGLPSPALAKSWEASESGKIWKFNLDTSKKWHDGKTVTASSIQYSFEDVVVERPDEATIVFKLQSPYSPFPLVVSRPTFARGLVGTGEWRVTNVSIVSQFIEQLDLEKDNGVHKIIRFYPNEDGAKTAFKLGQVDRLVDLLEVTPFDTWNTVNINKKMNDNRYVGVFLNERSPLFKDNKTLRQALAYAIDKSMWTGEVRALGPIPSRSWAYNSQIKPYDFDKARATDLLKTVIPKEGTLHIKLTSNPTLLPVAEKIAKDWKAVGIETEVQASTSLPSDYDAYLSLYQVSMDPDQYQTWHSTQEETNITHYANQRIDKLLEDGRLEIDHEKRKKIYLDFQRFLLEDVPAIFLYHPLSYEVLRK